MNTLHVVWVLVWLKLISARGPPTLSSHIQTDQIVHAGDTVKLLCPVNSDPPALTSWSKDGEDINIGWERFRIQQRGLRIATVMTEDSGQYVCTATNGFGTVSITYELHVLADDRVAEDTSEIDDSYADTGSQEVMAPRFSHASDMRHPHITQRIGDTVRLKCRSRGRPQPHVSWLKDGLPLSGEEMPVLRLAQLSLSDSGQYTCSLWNEAGSLNFTYTLDVVEILMEKPTLIAPFPVNLTVHIDDTASFMCRARSDLHARIRWVKRVPFGSKLAANRTVTIDNKPFMALSSSKTQIRQDGSYLSKLSIASAQIDDAGLYMCLASNSVGYSFLNAYLTVKSVVPSFMRPNLMHKGTMMRPVGATVRFDCRANGKPTPAITWYKDRRRLATESANKEAHWSLQLTELRQIDSGRYTCQLTNSGGSINFTYTLEVVARLTKPEFLEPYPMNTSVASGDVVLFHCTVHSGATPSIQWLKRIDGTVTSVMNATFTVDDQRFMVLDTGRDLARQNEAYVNKLTIRSARPSDAGMYVCLGANSVGYSVRSAYLTVLPELMSEEKTESFMDGASIPLMIGVPVAVLIAIICLTLYVIVCRRRQRTPHSPASSVSKTNPAADRPSYQMGVPDRRYIYTAVAHPNYPPSTHIAAMSQHHHHQQPCHSFNHSHHSFSPHSAGYSPVHQNVQYRPPFDAEHFTPDNYSDIRTETSSPTIAASLQYAPHGAPTRHA